MDDRPCRNFFLEPRSPLHRRYEALRAFFVEELPATEVATRFGYKPSAFTAMVSRFRGQVRQGDIPPFLSPTAAGVPRGSRSARTKTVRKKLGSPISGNST